MAYELIFNKIDYLIWVGIKLIMLEFKVLLFFKMMCPLTIIAGKHSDSNKENFDIYLPNWLAKVQYTNLYYFFFYIDNF
jgi:hypothetical protein